MRHITPERLEELGPLLERLRRLDGLDEKRPGGFSVKSRAFLHFHEDPAGLFADVRLDGAEFTRMRVSEPAERRADRRDRDLAQRAGMVMSRRRL